MLTCLPVSAVIAGIVRTIYLREASGSNPDKTWMAFNVMVAGTVEGNIGIVCACAPSLRSIYRSFFKPLLSIKATSTGNSTERYTSKFADSIRVRASRSADSKADLTVSPNYANGSGDEYHQEEYVLDQNLKSSNQVVRNKSRPNAGDSTVVMSWFNDNSSSITMSGTSVSIEEEEQENVLRIEP